MAHRKLNRMPLRAQIDNEEIISIDQTDDQWNELKLRLKNGSTLKLSCCNQDGLLRKSSKGLKHFIHTEADNTCDWKPESPEHLKAKIEIIEACTESGWKAIPEYSETNWRADVIAIKNEKRIAFNVHWSKQTFEEINNRQDIYKNSNVRGCWFIKTAPKELRSYDGSLIANRNIPVFKINKDKDLNIIGELNQSLLPLKELVNSLLERKIKFCEHLRMKSKQEATIVFFNTSCWKCKKEQQLYTIEQNLLTVCNQTLDLMGSMWDSEDIDKLPQVYNAVKQILKSDKGKNFRVGELKKRYSNTVQESYLSHGCFYCDVIFGDFYLNTEKMEGQNDSNSFRCNMEIDLGEIKEQGEHWCYSPNGQYCE